MSNPPDSIVVNGRVARGFLTPADKELWRLAEIRARVELLAELRAKVDALPHIIIPQDNYDFPGYRTVVLLSEVIDLLERGTEA